MRRPRLFVLGLGVLALVAAGCGDDEKSPTVAGDATTTPVVDDDARTLYLFTRQSPGASACTGLRHGLAPARGVG